MIFDIIMTNADGATAHIGSVEVKRTGKAVAKVTMYGHSVTEESRIGKLAVSLVSNPNADDCFMIGDVEISLV
jgi:hypothetical protein